VPRQSRKPTNLVTEEHVQKAVTDFLELDGWRAVRTDPVSDRGRGKGFGELGMPDYLYIRYDNMQATRTFAVLDAKDRNLLATGAQVMWIEFKRPGAKLEPHQMTWHRKEHERGAVVLQVNDIDGFCAWYIKDSGLNRRYTK
jgi:hypothetical protein